jgi:Tfp pilus assembly protein PilF
MKKKLIFTLIATVISSTFLFADELTEGYQCFITNKYTEAKIHFENASSIEANKAEAQLMLCLLAITNQEEETPFNYFQEFYKVSENPEPYLSLIFGHNGLIYNQPLKYKNMYIWLNELLEKDKLSHTSKGWIFETLGRYYEKMNDLKKSREIFKKSDAIMNWSIVGTFNNTSGSGFNKNYDPINHPEPSAIFKNKMGADVKWFDLHNKVDGLWIDFEYNFPIANSIIYSQTFCESSIDQTVNFCIGTSGSLKVWVNDQLLFSEETERNNGADTYTFPVKIAKGVNRILLQTGSSKISANNFLFRLLDNDGNKISNVSFSSTYQPYSKTIQELPSVETLFFEKHFQNLVETHPDKILYHIFLALSYQLNGKNTEAIEAIEQGLKLAPNCGYLLNQLVEVYTIEENKTLASLTKERLIQTCPDFIASLEYQITQKIESENINEANELISTFEKKYGERKDILLCKYYLAIAKEKINDANNIINKLYERYPQNQEIVNAKYDFEKNQRRNEKAANKVLKDFYKMYYNEDLYYDLSTEQLESGKTEEGLNTYKKIIEFKPYAYDLYHALGMFYSKEGNYKVGKSYLEESLKLAPYNGTVHANYAKVLEESGDKVNANNEYLIGTIYDPEDYDTKERLRKIQSKPDIFDLFEKKDYYKAFENTPTSKDYPSDNFLAITEEKQMVMYNEGGSEKRNISLYKVLTAKGIDQLKEREIYAAKDKNFVIEKAEVLKKNGNRLKAEIKDTKIVYTSLEVGDGVLLIYKQKDYVRGEFEKNIYEKYFFNNTYPVLNSEYSVLSPQDKVLKIQNLNTDIQASIHKIEDFNLYQWKATNQKSISPEPNMPHVTDIAAQVTLTTYKSWNQISNWYYDLTASKIKPTKIVIETVNQLLKNKPNISQIQKARLFYEYIVQNIRYSSVPFRQNGLIPQFASDVITTKIGDCKDLSVLFCSMCKVANIDASLVLVGSKEIGNTYFNLPGFNFDHCMAKINLDKDEYYIELTASDFPFSTIWKGQTKCMILDVTNSSDSIQIKNLPTNKHLSNSIIRKSKISFIGDGISQTTTTYRTGFMAALTRSTYRNQGQEEREKSMTQAISANDKPIKLISLTFDSTLNSNSDTLKYVYSYSMPKAITKVNDLNIFKLRIADQLDDMEFLSIQNRNYPIEVWKFDGTDFVSEDITIVIPTERKLVGLPKPAHYSCKFARYDLTFKQEGNELKISRSFVPFANNIPLSEIDSYKSFIESVKDADEQQLAFQ